MDLDFDEHGRARMVERKISEEWCRRVVADPVDEERQANGWTQYWGYIEETDQYIGVTVREDGRTVHTAHADRNFKRRMERGDSD